MSDKKSKDRVPLQLSSGVVIVPLRFEITNVVMEYLKEDLLSFVVEHNTNAVAFDLKGLEIMDADDFNLLSNLIKMLTVMGQEVMLCGLSPGIAAAIIEQGLDISDWKTAFNLNDAITVLNNIA